MAVILDAVAEVVVTVGAEPVAGRPYLVVTLCADITQAEIVIRDGEADDAGSTKEGVLPVRLGFDAEASGESAVASLVGATLPRLTEVGEEDVPVTGPPEATLAGGQDRVRGVDERIRSRVENSVRFLILLMMV